MSRRLGCFLPSALLALMVAGGWLHPGCHPSPQQRNEQQLSEVPRAEQHAIHSERLQAFMRNLDAWQYERLPPELENKTEVRRRLRRIAETADHMADSAQHIPDALDGIELTADERTAFVKFSDRLRQESAHLSRLARTDDQTAIAAAWQQIMATCDACHHRFRDLASVPASGRR